MGFFGSLLGRLSVKLNSGHYADMLDGTAPVFTQFGQNIYASDVVQQAVSCIVQEMKKLRPEHVMEKDGDISPVNSAVQRVLKQPNPYMTTSDFLEKITWLLFMNYNVFIIPTFEEWKDSKGNTCRRLDGLYPVLPSQVDFIEDAGNRLYVKFRFANGSEYILDYGSIIHIKYRYSVSELMGGNEAGQPDNGALLKTLEINHQLLQGVEKAMKATYAVNAVVKYKTMLDDGRTEKALRKLEKKLKRSESGFLPLDLTAEYIPIKKDIKLVDGGILKFIDEKILRTYGVSVPILTGDYTKEQYEAFYQKTLEPLVISFGQEFTKVLFTERERSFGNEIKFYPKDLIFMSTQQTLEMIRLLGDSGTLYENEKRTALGMRPLPELAGVRMQSLNYVDVNFARQYQAGGKEDQDGKE